ncbi:MAG: tetratricopeptide repeat protein [Endomicrobiaceae bacterium]|jgi:tetratricopeptide (TPR) repeat protein|nr:tetratricopeptide repeat protein [Endomicrobiaceae bacterium]
MPLRKILIAVLLLNVVCYSKTYATGKIYSLNPDPVSSAMADSGVALPSNFITGAIVNPASTVGIYRTVASLSTSNITGDIQYNYGGIGFLTSIGVFGASVMYVDYNIDQYYDNEGNIENLGQTYDVAAVLTYALPIKKYLPVFMDYGGFGANLKIMRSSLADYIAESIAVDFGGVLSIPKVKNVSFGFAFKNIGSSEKFVKRSSELPQTVAVGLGYSNDNFYKLKIAVDFNDQKNYEDYTSVGISISPVYFLALRAGLKMGGESLLNNARMGVGLEFQGVNFDYSFIPTSDLNATHNFNLSFAFGQFSDQKKAYEYYLENHFREAEANFYAKDFIKAREQFDDILSVYPDHKPSQEYLKKTVEELEKIDEYHLDIVNKYMAKAAKSLEKNDVVSADRYYRKVLELDPTNRVAKLGIEQSEAVTNSVKVQQSRAENSKRIEYLWKRYEKFYKKGDLVRARDSLKYLLDIDSENQLANEKIINVDNQLAKIASDKANEIYEQAMKYYNSGKYEEAIKYFEAVIVAAPHRLDVQNLIEKSEKNIQRIAEDQRLSALEAEQNKVRNQLIDTFNDGLKNYEKGKLESAVVYFQKAKEIAEKYEFTEYYKNAQNYISKISYNLSENYYKKGFEAYRNNDFELAAQSYKKSLEYNPGNTSASFELERVVDKVSQSFYERGMAAYSKNEMDKAREYLRMSLYYKPGKIEAQRALERIR